MGSYPIIIHSNATTYHDGGVAILLPNGIITALASERVGARIKHSGNSREVYEYLKKRFRGKGFGSQGDYFADPYFELENTGHHLYHASSSFFSSRFKEAAVLVIDGQGPEKGKMASTTIWKGDKNNLTLIESPFLTEKNFAENSVGHFYKRAQERKLPALAR